MTANPAEIFTLSCGISSQRGCSLPKGDERVFTLKLCASELTYELAAN